MPEYLAPGVYVEEVEIGAKPIEGVSTSTAGFVGFAERGPLNKPTLVTSFAEYQRIFGGYLDESYGKLRWLPYAVQGFFENGGKRLYVIRVASDEAKRSSGFIPNIAGKDTALGEDAQAKSKELTLEDTAGLEAEDVLLIKDSQYEYVKIKSIDGNKATLTEELKYGHKKGASVKKLTPAVKVEASSEGTWGNRIKIFVQPSSMGRATVKEVDQNYLTLDTISGIYAGSIIRLPDGNYVKVTEVIKTENKVVLEGNVSVEADSEVFTDEFDIIILFDEFTEVFKNLSMNEEHPNYVKRIINENSKLITVVDDSGGDKQLIPDKDLKWYWKLGGGDDGIPDENKVNEVYEGKDSPEPAERTGMYALKNIDEISIVAIPGITTQHLQDKLISHCDEMKDRFAVLDSEENANLDKIQKQRTLYDSKYAALYYPWIKIFDPLSKKNVCAPPSGHVCGVYARVDAEKGVHKAPANEKLNGVVGLERDITKGQQEILNPKGVNCIRAFPGRGIRIWGARTLSSDPTWKYINVRRLFLYLEESIEEGTQWVVFEPNDERLWARVKQTITQFLTRVWKDGALMGNTPEEAFFVKCDRTTMTQDDIDNGRLIVLIGVAPVKPAEFVVFRIAQWAGGSAVTE